MQILNTQHHLVVKEGFFVGHVTRREDEWKLLMWGFLAPCIPGKVTIKFSWRYVQCEPSRGPNRRIILVSDACQGANN